MELTAENYYGSFIEETTLHFEDDTFKKLRTEADQV